MFQEYGYDIFQANTYIDPDDLSEEFLPSQDVHTQAKETFQESPVLYKSGNSHRIIVAMQRKIADQKFQIFCMWLLLVVCAIVIISMRNSASQAAQLMYILQAASGKGSMIPLS